MNSIRFLLVNPINAYDTTENCFPNLGLGYLASAIRKEAPFRRGHTVEFRVVNGNIAEAIQAWGPHLVGITAVSQYYGEAMQHARIAKLHGLPVIMGGTHISALPQTLTSDMDIGVVGEGEKTIVELLALFSAEGKFYPWHLAEVNGIAYWNDGRVTTTNPRGLIQPLDSIPFPARDILKIEKHTSMFTSRGCPYRCTYCFSTRFWGKVRFFSAEYVVNEIETLFRKGVTQISLLDDLFIADTQRLTDILELLGKKNLLGKLTYICNVRSNLVTDELARALCVMGIRIVGMGIESGCQSTLEWLKGRGNITVEDHARAIQVLRDNGIAPHPSFIIGAPFEDRESILETIRFIKDNRIKDFEIYVLVPFPGTPVWGYALARGLVSENRLMDWARLYWDFGRNTHPVILSEKVSEQEIRGFYDELIERRARYIKRAQLRMLPGYLLKKVIERNHRCSL